MFCTKCGAQNEGCSFCQKCGAPLMAAGQPEVTPEVAPAMQSEPTMQPEPAPQPAPQLESAPQPEPTMQSTPQPQPQPRVIPQPIPVVPQFVQPVIPEEYKPISMWGYFGYELLFAIPCVGWIILLVFAFGGTKNVNLKNFARSYFCLLIIGIVIAIIVWIITAVLVTGTATTYSSMSFS